MLKLLVLITLLLGEVAGGQPLSQVYPTPGGYERVPVARESFAEFVRALCVLPDSAVVRFSDGHTASSWPPGTRVIDLPFLFEADLEQCADMALRLFCEYHWQRASADSLTFRLQNGQELAWSEWRRGRRLAYDAASDRHTYRATAADSSRAEFEQFLLYLFEWTGSVALKRDLQPVTAAELRPGDMIVQNTTGAMGHVSVILDVAASRAGDRLYLIGNGWTPAQSLFVRQPLAAEGSGEWFSLAGYEHHLSGYGFGPFLFRRF